MSGSKLSGRVCLVTGASRGIGRGIALQLGEAGAVVYITGRSRPDLERCGQELEERGGRAVTVVMDHTKDDQVKELFARIEREQNGRLDVLVNNAYGSVKNMIDVAQRGNKFWEGSPSESWDAANAVGLRNHYICAAEAAKLMVPRRSGLIVNISSVGGVAYLFHAAYGIGKAACDRMAADCAEDLHKHNVAFVSLWPGTVQTEAMKEASQSNEQSQFMDLLKSQVPDGESVEYAGKAVVHLALDPNVMSKTGKILLVSDVSSEYGFKDIDGRWHPCQNQLYLVFQSWGWNRLAAFTPGWIRVPLVFLHQHGYKFNGFL